MYILYWDTLSTLTHRQRQRQLLRTAQICPNFSVPNYRVSKRATFNLLLSVWRFECNNLNNQNKALATLLALRFPCCATYKNTDTHSHTHTPTHNPLTVQTASQPPKDTPTQTPHTAMEFNVLAINLSCCFALNFTPHSCLGVRSLIRRDELRYSLQRKCTHFTLAPQSGRVVRDLIFPTKWTNLLFSLTEKFTNATQL